MANETGLTYKVASEPWEFEQIYGLNYQTFVEEIPQHAPNEMRKLIDPYLQHSTCFVCTDGDEVVGMVTVSDERPFSIDHKLTRRGVELDGFLPEGARPCEIRLLAVADGLRAGRVFVGLMQKVLDHADDVGYDVGVFSAASSQARMYKHAGCVAFGPQLGTEDAPFQGMYISRELFSRSVRRLFRTKVGQPDTG